MDELLMQVEKLQVFSQFWMTLFLLVPLVLIARLVVSGTRYSAILFVVIFGLGMGHLLVVSGVATPGLPEFHMLDLISRTTIIPLTASFFVGGQELRRVFGKKTVPPDTLMMPSLEEVAVGTTRTQITYIACTFFLLLGIETLSRLILGTQASILSGYYSLLAYVGVICSIVLIDYKATIQNKKLYVKKGVLETVMIVIIMIASFNIAGAIRETIALPQIFFAMLMTCTLGAIFYKWQLGATLKALLFAGLPMVLGANFMIGGSRFGGVFDVAGMNSVLAFGFFGQVVWMFGGIALIMFFGKTDHVRNLAPGLAGGLSHAGLTGACTAGDLGAQAAGRAPIMINIPFTAHVFVFSILAISAAQGHLFMVPAIVVLVGGILLTAWSLKTLRVSNGEEGKEIRGLMKFSLGWQLTAIFGSFVLLSVFGMNFYHVAVSATSSLSHFGLFAATQGGMFGPEVAALLPLIFAMPFLVHPFVFFFFGAAMANDGHMPKKPVYLVALIGVVGVAFSIFLI
ncbi:MAG: hypothetical protein FWD00_02725 [Clostridiales bacterium]|nr:hypothetical protein [Clostridiales bacterium]